MRVPLWWAGHINTDMFTICISMVHIDNALTGIAGATGTCSHCSHDQMYFIVYSDSGNCSDKTTLLIMQPTAAVIQPTIATAASSPPHCTGYSCSCWSSVNVSSHWCCCCVTITDDKHHWILCTIHSTSYTATILAILLWQIHPQSTTLSDDSWLL